MSGYLFVVVRYHDSQSTTPPMTVCETLAVVHGILKSDDGMGNLKAYRVPVWPNVHVPLELEEIKVP